MNEQWRAFWIRDTEGRSCRRNWKLLPLNATIVCHTHCHSRLATKIHSRRSAILRGLSNQWARIERKSLGEPVSTTWQRAWLQRSRRRQGPDQDAVQVLHCGAAGYPNADSRRARAQWKARKERKEHRCSRRSHADLEQSVSAEPLADHNHDHEPTKKRRLARQTITKNTEIARQALTPEHRLSGAVI